MLCGVWIGILIDGTMVTVTTDFATISMCDISDGLITYRGMCMHRWCEYGIDDSIITMQCDDNDDDIDVIDRRMPCVTHRHHDPTQLKNDDRRVQLQRHRHNTKKLSIRNFLMLS